jgi:hypothetical protein
MLPSIDSSTLHALLIFGFLIFLLIRPLAKHRKKILDIVTGNLHRKNRVFDYAIGDSLALLKELHLEGTMHTWALSVIFSTEGVVRRLTLEADFPEWKAAVKDRAKVRRLACFIAWLLTDRAIERNPSWFFEDEENKDTLGIRMKNDFIIIRKKLFPNTEPEVAESIARYEKADRDVLQKLDTFRHSLETLAVFESLLGLVPDIIPDKENKDVSLWDVYMRKDGAYTAAIITGINSVPNYMRDFSKPIHSTEPETPPIVAVSSAS